MKKKIQNNQKVLMYTKIRIKKIIIIYIKKIILINKKILIFLLNVKIK